jgi:3-oxoacyl-[acyl-carrier protein] reductase
MSSMSAPEPAVAIVTGSGRGVGRHLAERLAGRGLAVTGTSRTAAELAQTAAAIERAGGLFLPITGDVSDAAHVDDVVARTLDRFGRIDVLVNNAGVAPAIGPFWETDPTTWWATVTTNVLGPALMLRAVLPRMLAQGNGLVVNINSLGGMRPFPGSSAYCVSKAALARLGDTVSEELGDSPVTIVDLSPGTVRTAMSTGLGYFDDFEDGDWTPVERVGDAVVALLSGRYGAFGGRFVHAEDDLDDILARVELHGGRQLRLTTAGPDDPLFE